jgi:hypothetical protein
MTPTFTQTEVDRIYPGWQLEKIQSIHFHTHDSVVAVIAKSPNMSDARLIVVQFDSVSGSWLIKWSEDITPNGYGKLQYLWVTQPNSEGTALALVSADAVAMPVGAVALVLKIDDGGTCILEETFYSPDFSIEQQENVLIVNGSRKLGQRTLSLQGNNYVDHRAPQSQLSPTSSIKVAFKLDTDGNVVPVQQKTLTMRVCQTIEFVPADAETKEEFDQGNIEVYTDWGTGILNTTIADSIWSGNYYKFDKNGTVQFLLITDKKMDDPALYKTPTSLQVSDTKVTFIVHVPRFHERSGSI